MGKSGAKPTMNSCDLKIVQRQKKINQYFFYGVLLIPILLILFVNSQENNENIIFNIQVPFNSLVIYPIIMVWGTINLVLFKSGEFVIDNAFLLLLLRIPLLLLPLFYTTEFGSYPSKFMVVLVAPYSYIISKNMYKYKLNEYLTHIIVLMNTIIFIQIICSTIIFFQHGLPLWMIKSYIAIPIGKSNYIASILIVCFFYAYINIKNKWIKMISLLMTMISLLLTLSYGGIVSVLLGIILDFMMTKENRGKKVLYLLMLSLCISGSILTIDNISPNLLDRYLMKFDESADFNQVGNGRMEIFEYNADKFLSNPILGSGLGLPPGDEESLGRMRPHNIVLEALVNGGVINLLLYFGAIYLVLNAIYIKVNQDRQCKAVFIIIFAIIVHGMVEVNLFTVVFDFFFWMIMGFNSAHCRYYGGTE